MSSTLFLFFLLVSTALLLTNHTFLGTDEITLWHMLVNGEHRTLILSIPLAWVISHLYQVAPSVPWFSFTFFFVMIYLIYLFVKNLEICQRTYTRYALIIFFTFLLIYLWLNLSLATLTLMLLIFSFPLLKDRPELFFVSLVIASFLRYDIILSSLPYLAIAFVIAPKRSIMKTPKTIFLALLAVGMLVMNTLLPSQDREYSDWLTFNAANSYFVDLGGKNFKHILSDDEISVLKFWWAQDEGLIPTEKIVEGAGTQGDIIKSALLHFNVQKLFNILIHNPFILFALFLTVLVLMNKEVPLWKKSLLVVYILGFFLLLYIRNVARVSFPLTLLWYYLMFAMAKDHVTPSALRYTIAFLSVLVLVSLPINKIYGKYKYRFYKDEYEAVVAKHPELVIENASGFPMGNVIQTIDQLQHHLFDEKEWIYGKYPNIKFAGWTCRHPFFYQEHDISFHGERRKYENYYQFMVSPETAYIGDVDRKEKKVQKLLDMYDKKYGIPNGCRHRIITIEKTPHVLLQRIECAKVTELRTKGSL